MEYKEVLGFDEDVFCFEGFVVLLCGYNMIVDVIFISVLVCDGLFLMLFFVSIVFVDGYDLCGFWVFVRSFVVISNVIGCVICGLGRVIVVDFWGFENLVVVYKVFEVGGLEMWWFDVKDEGYGIYIEELGLEGLVKVKRGELKDLWIWFFRFIRVDNGGEVGIVE